MIAATAFCVFLVSVALVLTACVIDSAGIVRRAVAEWMAGIGWILGLVAALTFFGSLFVAIVQLLARYLP